MTLLLTARRFRRNTIIFLVLTTTTVILPSFNNKGGLAVATTTYSTSSTIAKEPLTSTTTTNRRDVICPDHKDEPLADIFCGRGPTSEDCPTGYECLIHETDRYAVCCPVVVVVSDDVSTEEQQEEDDWMTMEVVSETMDNSNENEIPTSNSYKGGLPAYTTMSIAKEPVKTTTTTTSNGYKGGLPAYTTISIAKEPVKTTTTTTSNVYKGGLPAYNTMTTTTTTTPDQRDICPDPKDEPFADVFCGRGPQSQDCPEKYECVIHETDRYAVCCPVVVVVSDDEEQQGDAVEEDNAAAAYDLDVTTNMGALELMDNNENNWGGRAPVTTTRDVGGGSMGGLKSWDTALVQSSVGVRDETKVDCFNRLRRRNLRKRRNVNKKRKSQRTRGNLRKTAEVTRKYNDAVANAKEALSDSKTFRWCGGRS